MLQLNKNIYTWILMLQKNSYFSISRKRAKNLVCRHLHGICCSSDLSLLSIIHSGCCRKDTGHALAWYTPQHPPFFEILKMQKPDLIHDTEYLYAVSVHIGETIDLHQCEKGACPDHWHIQVLVHLSTLKVFSWLCMHAIWESMVTNNLAVNCN